MVDATTPLFIRIAEDLEHEILRGTYPPDTPVPSTNELARFIRVNPATAGKGLNLLVDRGVLYKRRGIGMFVSPTARDTIRSRRRTEFAADYIDPLLAEAHRLGIDLDTLIEMLTSSATEHDGHGRSATDLTRESS
ncbi:DNA-binding transcriptional regulator YhcF (GntR family) [Brevibacterium sanguinis]|uniref:DNA-binding transcriptional regulator YhcF (GntR family) n=2 Tax=Brevibacterium TaxID=1696 RepID=A0A366IJM6_9MICO|nr:MULTISPECIES: GntR family transcriptional regulator [Brevibacterium]RBP64208.1 DNA-binding transcriptional regulator YhcF (GntR family) [Brevibacterium sanguinis]RBP71500.1 DNA-binding transcriptional regulator YhcF (GntR family) [Brevibacterium celere]